MASIYREVSIDAPAGAVWDAVRDFYRVHLRLVPGFVTACERDGDDRIVTFANGMQARELLVTCDDQRRRLVYAVVGARVRQHSAAVQVIETGGPGCTIVWTVDVLPDAVAPYLAGQMELAAGAMQLALTAGGQPA